MMKIINAIIKFFKPRSIEELRDEYLAKSHDLVELERRQRELINPNLRGWI